MKFIKWETIKYFRYGLINNIIKDWLIERIDKTRRENISRKYLQIKLRIITKNLRIRVWEIMIIVIGWFFISKRY